MNPEAVVTVPFSSGTTGRPKGVCLTHRNLTTNVEQIIGVDPLRRGQTLLGVLPVRCGVKGRVVAGASA